MSSPSPSTRALARRLLVLESERNEFAGDPCNAAVLVSRRLCVSLTTFVGLDGYKLLLARALSLAKREDPRLAGVAVGEDGALDEFEKLERQHGAASAAKSGKLLVAYLLELLVAFVGEEMTLRLLHVTWPNAGLDTMEQRTEEDR